MKGKRLSPGKVKVKNGAALLWARSHSALFTALPLGLIREICEYFNAVQLVDVYANTFTLFHVGTKQTRSRRLTIKVKERPPLLVWKSSVYLFSCGADSNSQAENWTYEVNLSAHTVRLANSPLAGLSGSAALHDPDHGYMYLFGGSKWFSKSSAIQVYSLKSANWTAIRAEMRFGRSHFSAVNHQRSVYLVGGCKEPYLERYGLDTGESDLLLPGFRADLLHEGAILWKDMLVCLYSDRLICVKPHLSTKTRYIRICPGVMKPCFGQWKAAPKRVVGLQDTIMILCRLGYLEVCLDESYDWS